MAEELHRHAETALLGDLLEPDQPVNDDGSLQQDTVEPAPAAQPDPEPETGKPDTEEVTGGEQEQPVDWATSELAQKYGDPQKAWQALQEKEQRIGHLTNMVYNRPQEQPAPKIAEPVTVDPETFYQNPTESIKRMGLVSREEAAQIASQSAMQIIEQERVSQFFKSAADFPDLEPKMIQILDDYPDLRQLPKSQALKVLYRLAKADQQPQKPTVKIEPSDPAKKERAQTSGGRSVPNVAKTKKPHEYTQDELSRMSEKQLEELYGFSG